jgi:hypothetical protein
VTADDIFGDSRRWTNDASKVRWPDATMLIFLDAGLEDLWVRCRSAFNITSIPTTMPTKPTAVGSTVYVQDRYREPLSHYLAWACLLEDAEDTSNAKLAQYHWDKYEAGV